MSKNFIDDLELTPRRLTVDSGIPTMATLEALKEKSKEHFEMKNMIACLLVVALTGCSIWADPGPDQAHADGVKKKVAHCLDHQRRAVFETYDNRRLQGFITEAGADDFVVSYAGQKTTLLYRDVSKIKWQSPVVRQIKIAAGAAAMTGALFGLVVLLGGLRG